MSTFPNPPPGWPAHFTAAMQQIMVQLRADISALELKTTQAGKIILGPVGLTRIGEVPCNGAVYNRVDMPLLFRAISTAFNTGGETASQFRVPSLPAPHAGLEYRISTG